jgi:hypothetical protein
MPKRIEEPFTRVPEVPAEILNPTGLVGEVASFIYKNSYVPNKLVAYCGAICSLSYFMGARYRTPDGVYPGIYCILLGRTGSGKDSAFRGIRDLVKGLASYIRSKDPSLLLLRKGIVQKLSTRQGIEDLLSGMDTRPDLLVEIDEIGKFLQIASRSGGTNDYAKSFSSLLVEMYNSNAMHFRNLSEAGSKKGARLDVIDHPSLTIMGATNMMSLTNGIGVEQIYDGFINRFMWFDIDLVKEEIPLTSTSFDPGEGLLDKLYKIAKIKGIGSSQLRSLKPNVIKYAEGAQELFVKYDRHVRSDEGAKTEKQLAFATRVALQAKKLATIYAICENRKNPIITFEMAEQSLVIAHWCSEKVSETINENIVDENISNIIQEVKVFLDTYSSKKCGISLMSLNDISSYRAARSQTKAEIRTEFLNAHGDVYTLKEIPTPGKGINPKVFFRIVRNRYPVATSYRRLNHLKKKQGTHDMIIVLSPEQIQGIRA